MLTCAFSYTLPESLIAQYPAKNRSDSRLLQLSRSAEPGASNPGITDRRFSELAELLNTGDVLVFNNTRVIPARLYAHKATGGRVEVMVERKLEDGHFLAQLRASKPPKEGALLSVKHPQKNLEYSLRVEGRRDDLFVLSCVGKAALSEILQQVGHMPLPPYIARDDESIDFSRYQTVYAAEPGAVAAPTAGLHFDESLLETLAQKGVESAYVTLHVGAGTFQPVRSEHIEQHKMHSELVVVPQQTVDACRLARERGGRVIAVGTTAVRSLETASVDGELSAFSGDTNIFIYPGYAFHSVDAILTNFHLPESTLLMLVCAFAGVEPTLRAYQHAVAQQYRFFSYGDAMLIT